MKELPSSSADRQNATNPPTWNPVTRFEFLKIDLNTIRSSSCDPVRFNIECRYGFQNDFASEGSLKLQPLQIPSKGRPPLLRILTMAVNKLEGLASNRIESIEVYFEFGMQVGNPAAGFCFVLVVEQVVWVVLSMGEQNSTSRKAHVCSRYCLFHYLTMK